jgi:hypothetical protein
MDASVVLSRPEIEALEGADLDRALLAAESRVRESQREVADILPVAEQRKRHRATASSANPTPPTTPSDPTAPASTAHPPAEGGRGA